MITGKEKRLACTICGVIKTIDEFKKVKSSPHGYERRCKKCVYKDTRKWLESHPWCRTLHHIRSRCHSPTNRKYPLYGGRGIKCLLTKDEIKLLWDRDKASLLEWPTIDRLDPNSHYELKNCRFIEQKENSRLGGLMSVIARKRKRALSKIGNNPL